MNILIIASYYEQDRYIASVRWTNLAYRLATRHRIYVLAESFTDSPQMAMYQSAHDITVMRMDQRTIYEKISERIMAKKSSSDPVVPAVLGMKNPPSIKKRIIRVIKNRLCLLADYLMAQKQMDYVLQQVKRDKVKFDVVISSARPFRQFIVGAMLAQKLNCAWISDFRDLPFSSWSDPDDIRLQSKLIIKYFPLAYATTLVSKGMCQAFVEINKIPEELATRVKVLSNGFSYADSKETAPKNPKDRSKLTIAYTGTLYRDGQDASILFAAIAELIVEEKITYDQVNIEYAGNSVEDFIAMAKRFGVSSIIHNNGFISRQEALEIQREADLLLLLTWNTYLARGILTGKMYEYILCKKPIICITSGDLPNSEATEMIRKYRLGIACENTSYEEDVRALMQYLLMQLRRKQAGHFLVYDANSEALQEFSHDNIAVQLENICFEAIKEKAGNEYLHCAGLVSGK